MAKLNVYRDDKLVGSGEDKVHVDLNSDTYAGGVFTGEVVDPDGITSERFDYPEFVVKPRTITKLVRTDLPEGSDQNQGFEPQTGLVGETKSFHISVEPVTATADDFTISSSDETVAVPSLKFNGDGTFSLDVKLVGESHTAMTATISFGIKSIPDDKMTFEVTVLNEPLIVQSLKLTENGQNNDGKALMSVGQGRAMFAITPTGFMGTKESVALMGQPDYAAVDFEVKSADETIARVADAAESGVQVGNGKMMVSYYALKAGKTTIEITSASNPAVNTSFDVEVVDDRPAFDPAGDVKPTDTNTVDEITAWLDAHSIDHAGKTLKADLLALVPAE